MNGNLNITMLLVLVLLTCKTPQLHQEQLTLTVTPVGAAIGERTS